ncbi:HAD family hydrolase [Marivirga sp.]|uniref:HAD family hydrolase n=1 Tax=Marivirga sp. TaxID=2018662 RepID=UPI0025EDF90B|nr:HAD family hydrolase [Marivirga sp.]
MSKVKAKPSIAFFDFDGTITKEDSMWLFLKYLSGNSKFYLNIIPLIPVLVLFKLNLISSKNGKEAIFKKFFKNCDLILFEEHCKKFTQQILINQMRPEVLNKMTWHKENDHQIVVVSASPKNWINYWCEDQGIDLIATELEIQNGKLTGKIAGENCKGKQKVIRIKQKYDLGKFDTVYAYGDSTGDKEMLSMADRAFYRGFS